MGHRQYLEAPDLAGVLEGCGLDRVHPVDEIRREPLDLRDGVVATRVEPDADAVFTKGRVMLPNRCADSKANREI